MDFIFACIAGMVTGILSAFGVGGGTLLLIYLSAFTGIPQQVAQGINLLYFLPASLASLPSHFKNGFIERRTLIPAISCGIFFTIVFACIATGMETKLLRRLFGIFLVIIGLKELLGKKQADRETCQP